MTPTPHNGIERKENLIRWFSGLPLEVCQKIDKDFSKFLSSFIKVKTTRGNLCRLRPCGKRQYSRRFCANHYQIVRRIIKGSNTKWDDFIKQLS